MVTTRLLPLALVFGGLIPLQAQYKAKWGSCLSTVDSTGSGC